MTTMSAFSREALESISKWSEILGAAFALLAGASAVMFIIVNRPLRRIEALESLQEKQKTALAQKEAAEAQLALKENIEYTVTPRRIVIGSRDGDDAIRAAKFEELEKYKGTQALVMPISGDNEAKTLADDIGSALLKSGWKVNVGEIPANIPRGFIENGVRVRTLVTLTASELGKSLPVPPVAYAVVDLLNLDLGPPRGPIAAVAWNPNLIFPDGNPANSIGLTRYGFNFPKDEVVITVGAKPAREFFITHRPPQPTAPE